MKKIIILFLLLFFIFSCSIFWGWNKDNNITKTKELNVQNLVSTWSEQSNTNSTNVQKVDVQKIDEQKGIQREKKLYWNTLSDIIKNPKIDLHKKENPNKQEYYSERLNVYEFFVFCKGLIGVDILDKDSFIDYLDLRVLHDYLKKNNFSLNKKDELLKFLQKIDGDFNEVNSLLYIEWKITKKELFWSFTSSYPDSILYFKALKFKIENILSKEKCENIVLDSWIKLD